MKFNKFSLFCILFFLSVLIGCQGTVYKKWEKSAFPNYMWQKNNVIDFKPEVSDISKSYRIIIGIRHIYGLKLPYIPVQMTIISPTGITRKFEYQIFVIDEKGKPIADCSGSLCDIEQEVESSFRFEEPGQHTISISQISGLDYINGIMEVGLIIKTQ